MSTVIAFLLVAAIYGAFFAVQQWVLNKLHRREITHYRTLHQQEMEQAKREGRGRWNALMERLGHRDAKY